MGDLWIANMEDEASPASYKDASIIYNYVKQVNARHILHLNDNDSVVLPYEVDREFIAYCSRVKNMKDPNIIYVSNKESNSLVDNILSNEDVLKNLRSICEKQKLSFQPYRQTANTKKLADIISARWQYTSSKLLSSGMVDQANSKVFMKEFVSSLGIKTAPHKISNNIDDLKLCIESLGLTNDKLFLRKDGMTGGMGNLAGDVKLLMDCIDEWHENATILVEPFLPFSASVGSLLEITDSDVRLYGLNEQVFNEQKWIGFKMPYADSGYVEKIEALSMQIANHLMTIGLRGWVNFDWGVVDSDCSNAGLREGEIIFNECNFRYTAVYRIWKFASDFFKDDMPKIKLQAYDEYPTADGVTFGALLKTLSQIRHDGRSVLLGDENRTSGVIITRPPEHGTCGIVIFGRSSREIRDYLTLLEKNI